MNSVRSCLLITLLTFVSSICVGQKKQPEIPNFLKGDSIPANSPHDWNLGPTGLRGWMYSHRLETTQARQIQVTSVTTDSPAEGKLKIGDVILGLFDTPFSYDPRTEFGKAIQRAEASDGNLDLMRWRQGETETVTLKLPVLGSYSSTAPFNCAKSKAIFESGCDALADRMNSGYKPRNPIIRSLNTLALLSSGREEFLPIIKRQIEWAAKYSDVECRTLCCWHYGPVNMLLAEYTLSTGDQSYLPDLKRISMEIVNGQSKVGSWGHRFARPDGRLKGYGMMNAPGLPLTVSLILARRAGVNDPKLDEAIAKSVRLMRFYVGKGCVPYGDHHPWLETHDDNGKNGIAALMFNLLEDQEAATFFSRMSVASHGAEREMGHTGNFFNMLWALPGVAISGPNASGAWMNEFGWYYDLARLADGTFLHQGPAQPRFDSYRNWDSTGAYLLAMAQPLRQLYITGKKVGVVPQASSETAAGLVRDGQGYSHRIKESIYSERNETELMNALTSWSPVVRERAAAALARRQGDFANRLSDLIESDDLHAQLGACQAISKLGNRAKTTVPILRKLLGSDHLWLQIKAADALAAIGTDARAAIPDLLRMLGDSNLEEDPRGMLQRYLTFALFDRRNGLLSRSLEDVNREELYSAVRAGLMNEDGRARSSISSVYKNLSYQEIEPLLPAIYDAVFAPAPSGNMFADGIRLAGLEVLANHRIKEGLPLCLDVIELDRWSSAKRIPKCLGALKSYGGAAKSVLPKLRSLKQQLSEKKRLSDKDKKNLKLVEETILAIESSVEAEPLRSLVRKS